jgi:hypothetical protein
VSDRRALNRPPIEAETSGRRERSFLWTVARFELRDVAQHLLRVLTIRVDV